MDNKPCVYDPDKLCDDCGDCRCDMDPEKICDNCMQCVIGDAHYRAIAIQGITWGEPGTEDR